jgi:hypothetical protein
MRRLNVDGSRTDRKLAKKMVGYIERDRYKKLKKIMKEENIHPGEAQPYPKRRFRLSEFIEFLSLLNDFQKYLGVIYSL